MAYPFDVSDQQIKTSRVKPVIAGIGVSALTILGLLFYFADKAEKKLPVTGEVRIEAINVGKSR